ncbi:MAG TPA: TerD family protein [Pyrinomonadaceae bacterium]|nr:TerD family protein [Pyrinomonadaceae bacterium]
MMNPNSILLRRRNKVIVPRGSGRLPPSHVAAINKNLEGLGYTLSARVLDALASLSPEEAAPFYEEVLAVLKELRGVKDYRPMYPNFPRQVMEADAARLYLNAMLHYLTAWVADLAGGRREIVWLPDYRKERRDPLEEGVKLTVIEPGTEEELREIFSKMISSKTSISETDGAELKWFAENYPLTLPEVIPNKEVLAFVGSLMPERPELKAHVKTATDVLRLAAAMSGGDVSLAESTKFRSFKRGERRALLALLENCGDPVEDMLRWKKRWLRLGERIHPGEYRKLYPKAAQGFDILRNDVPVPTFNSKVEGALRVGNVHEAVDLLRNRPGEFARRLDQLLRMSPSPEATASFGEVAHGVSTPVLLQTISHFKRRDAARDLRIFFPKGSLAKVMAIGYDLPEIPRAACGEVVRICEGVLVGRFERLPPLGKVFIDEGLRDYLVPFSQRSASRSLRTLVRGSKVSFGGEGYGTIRFFLWWKEGEMNGKETDRVDIDLSAVLYDADWQYREHVSYTNLRSFQYNACHSGDVTAAPHGACEFIDVDIPSVLDYGGRYVVMSVNSFTGQKFIDLPECRAGWMMRERPDSGEVFEPGTVRDRVDVASDTTICIPVVLDLAERKVVWADVGLKRDPRFVNNVEGNFSQVTLLGKLLTEVVKPDLHSLFLLHAEARGSLVESKGEADTIFSLEEGITPFDIETIASEYL